MGISAKGFLWAKNTLKKRKCCFDSWRWRISRRTNFEALQTTAHQKLNDLIVMDHNKIQSSHVKKIIDLRKLKQKLDFGWYVERRWT